MNAIRGIIVAAILLTASQAGAVATLFNIYFHDTRTGVPGENGFAGGHLVGPSDFQGTYIITDGVLTAFSAPIGQCMVNVAPDLCIYNVVDTNNPDPGGPADGNFDIDIINTRRGDRLTYRPGAREWATVNSLEADFANFFRFGVYRVEATVPEPSSIWLILAGAALIAAPKFAKR